MRLSRFVRTEPCGFTGDGRRRRGSPRHHGSAGRADRRAGAEVRYAKKYKKRKPAATG